MSTDTTYPETEELSDEDRVAKLNSFFVNIYPGGVFGIKTVGTQRKLYFSLPKYSIYTEQDLPEKEGKKEN